MNFTSKISKKKHILQFIPKKLSFLKDTKFIFFENKKLKTAYLIDIIHKMMCKKFFSNKLIINLSSIILRQWYGTFYNDYINYLLKHDIIFLISNYCAGVKCSTYKLNPNCFTDQDIIRFKNDDKILVKKWIKAKLSNDITNLSDGLSENIKTKLIKDLFYVELDFEKASQYLKDAYTKKDIDFDCYWKNQLSIEAIEDGSIFYVEDDYGRLHTNFTILKKVIRKEFITIDGFECQELDIACSQPVFLISILKKLSFDKNYPTAFQKYLDVVKNGSIYEIIGNHYQQRERKAVKKGVYKVLFGKQNLRYKENKIFYKLFPEVFTCIKDYKRDNYKKLSHELQRLESNLIFNHICFRLKKELPEMKLITIHDSIYFPKQYSEKVSKIFYDFVETLY